MRDFKKYRDARNLSGATALEIAFAAGINRSQLSLYESGAIKLNDAQVEKLRKALIAATMDRLAKLRDAMELLTGSTSQNESATGAGAPSGGLESELRCDERAHAG